MPGIKNFVEKGRAIAKQLYVGIKRDPLEPYINAGDSTTEDTLKLVRMLLISK